MLICNKSTETEGCSKIFLQLTWKIEQHRMIRESEQIKIKYAELRDRENEVGKAKADLARRDNEMRNKELKMIERNDRTRRYGNKLKAIETAVVMNDTESKPRQIVTRTMVFSVSLQNINEVSHYHVSQSMTY